jgi:hypothetical protein
MPMSSEINDPQYKSVLNDFESGSIICADRMILQNHLLTIAQNATGDDAVQARDIYRSSFNNTTDTFLTATVE